MKSSRRSIEAPSTCRGLADRSAGRAIRDGSRRGAALLRHSIRKSCRENDRYRVRRPLLPLGRGRKFRSRFLQDGARWSDSIGKILECSRCDTVVCRKFQSDWFEAGRARNGLPDSSRHLLTGIGTPRAHIRAFLHDLIAFHPPAFPLAGATDLGAQSARAAVVF